MLHLVYDLKSFHEFILEKKSWWKNQKLLKSATVYHRTTHPPFSAITFNSLKELVAAQDLVWDKWASEDRLLLSFACFIVSEVTIKMSSSIIHHLFSSNQYSVLDGWSAMKWLSLIFVLETRLHFFYFESRHIFI